MAKGLKAVVCLHCGHTNSNVPAAAKSTVCLGCARTILAKKPT
jgi:ribosomal protein S27E